MIDFSELTILRLKFLRQLTSLNQRWILEFQLSLHPSFPSLPGISNGILQDSFVFGKKITNILRRNPLLQKL